MNFLRTFLGRHEPTKDQTLSGQNFQILNNSGKTAFKLLEDSTLSYQLINKFAQNQAEQNKIYFRLTTRIFTLKHFAKFPKVKEVWRKFNFECFFQFLLHILIFIISFTCKSMECIMKSVLAS